jgi:hypothetical protein
MKKHYFIILFLLFISNLLLSQTGTIKIVKPKKDTTLVLKRSTVILVTIGSNYTFKGNNKFGFDGGITFPIISPGHYFNIYSGLEYSHENQYYALSPYNKITSAQETPHSRSQNTSDRLKIPIGIMYHFVYGSAGYALLSAKVLPEYLLKTKDQYGRLNYSDFNRFNLAAGISIGIHVLRHYAINIGYSKDLFENLKDRNIYDQYGTAQGKQKSRTNLLSLSLSYHISYSRK